RVVEIAEVVVPGDLAAENGILLPHPALDERVPDAVHQRAAAETLHRVLHRPARAQVVDDGRARMLQQDRPAAQRRAEVTRHELALAVEKEAAVRGAIPRDADLGLPADD